MLAYNISVVQLFIHNMQILNKYRSIFFEMMYIRAYLLGVLKRYLEFLETENKIIAYP